MTDQESSSANLTCEKTNEEFEICGTSCPLSCENLKNPPIFCTEECAIGCACKEGFIRDTKTGNCVPPENCTGSNNSIQWLKFNS